MYGQVSFEFILHWREKLEQVCLGNKNTSKILEEDYPVKLMDLDQKNSRIPSFRAFFNEAWN